ncbi:hypothetical protein SAMN04488587_2002 [Methanococcoides vulcani]|uniref:HEPN domain-containing protein n=1 Tax=Methanococcoides vulcani TaxID=1353158 RepID=A0A1I0B6G2_9EURY|nr:hypothetical protein [Methanococcoides vulcani]SET02364.1 hypothetical protein SAMN04488587_2002 [Methanococcoides vulcani]
MSDFELPKRPDRSLKLYEPDGKWEDKWRQAGYVYNGGKGGTVNLWNAYSIGYLEASKKLIEVAKRDDFTYDTFGYPIFYLFYHYLELRMKDIIINGRALINENTGYPNIHDLNQLWNECKSILKKMEGWEKYSELPDDIKKDYQTMDHFIKEIAKDGKAQSFRYPVDKKGNEFLSDNSIRVFNISSFSSVVDWLSLMLEGISTGIDESLSAKYEYEAEYAGEDYY